MKAIPGLLLLAVFSLSACKSTEDYLYDLGNVYDRGARRIRPEVYDGGQLVHEAFSGISEQDVLTVSQMARAIALSAYVISQDREVVPLTQAQGVYTIARLAVRYPVPPVSESYQYTDKAEVEELVAAQITALGEQQDRLGVPASIALLRSPDHAVVEKTVERLHESTGQNYGRNISAWEAWWTRVGPSVRRDAAAASSGPMSIIGEARYSDLTQAAAVLNFIGLHAAIFDMPEMRETQTRTILRVARQVVVLAIDRALRRGDTMVRGAAAQAAAKVIDPAFLPAIIFAMQREKDGLARARMIEALANYPGRETMVVLMGQLRDDDRTVTVHAHRALIAVSGEDFGSDAQPWQLWWDQTGKTRWP